MSEDFNRFLASLRDKTQDLELSTVEAIDAEYPFFTLADAMLLQQGGGDLDEPTRRRLGARVALNSADPDTLSKLIDREHDTWSTFYPVDEEAGTVTTDDAITTFLNTYGNSDPAQDALLERMIFNPVPDDYMSLLEKEGKQVEEPAEEDSQDRLIDAFLNREEKPAKGPVDKETAGEETEAATAVPDREQQQVETPPPYRPKKHRQAQMAADNTSLSESLAKIYIKQRRYDKAFEIIQSLSLKNPKKSIYFADQLRFLRKLIINQQHQK